MITFTYFILSEKFKIFYFYHFKVQICQAQNDFLFVSFYFRLILFVFCIGDLARSCGGPCGKFLSWSLYTLAQPLFGPVLIWIFIILSYLYNLYNLVSLNTLTQT